MRIDGSVQGGALGRDDSSVALADTDLWPCRGQHGGGGYSDVAACLVLREVARFRAAHSSPPGRESHEHSPARNGTPLAGLGTRTFR